MTIPARAHFCWIGPKIPWAYVFAILSAAERSELSEIILHHTDVLDDDAGVQTLRQAPRVHVSRIDPIACLRQAGEALGLGDGLASIYRGLESPAIRTDIFRAAILYLEGGVYLDLDTITTNSLLPLLDRPHFVGSEYIVWPQSVRASRSPVVWARHLGLDLLRKALRSVPDGWETFRRIERLYFLGVNGAIMGAEANSPLCADYLRAMMTVPRERQPQPYALGPDLLYRVVDLYRQDGLTVQAPRVFYPLAPEISEHWFRIGRPARLDAVLSPETRVAHWYASVRTRDRVAQIDPAYVRRHRKRQLYSALVCECIRDLPDAA